MQRIIHQRKRIWFQSWRLKAMKRKQEKLMETVEEKSADAEMWEESALLLREKNCSLEAEVERLRKRRQRLRMKICSESETKNSWRIQTSDGAAG